jgi:hypothetical protein
MITTIRSQFKQTTYRYIVFFMVFIIAASMVSSMLVKSDRVGESWAVRVNGIEISYQDFNRETVKQTEYLAHMRAQYGQYADLLFQSMGWSTDPKTRALDILIKEELINQYGDMLGMVVSPTYVATVINNASFVKQNLGHVVPSFAFDQAGVLDMNIIKSFLHQNGITAQQFEKNIERALMQLQVMEIVANASYTPLFDSKQQFIARNLAKTFSCLTFSLDQFLAIEKKNTVSDEDLQLFYDAQNTQFRRYWIPEKRTASMWTFDPKRYNVTISDEEITRYYEDNKLKNYVLEPLKVEVEKIALNTLENTDNLSFDEIRHKLVNNTSSVWAKQWKAMKPFARGEYKGELEKAAFVLQNEGEVSPVFETDEGPVVIKLVKRIARTYKPLSVVKNDIKMTLANKAFKKSFAKDIKALLQGDQNAIESFIADKAGKKEVVSGITKDDSKLSQELFSLKKGQYSFYLDGETGVLVLLSDIVERYLPDLQSIKDTVKGDYYEYRAKKSLDKIMAEVEQSAETKTFQELQNVFGGTLQTLPMVSPADHKKLQELDKKGFPVREMIALEKIGSLLVSHNDRDSVLVRLDEVEAYDENKFLAAKKEIETQTGAVRRRLFVDGFVASLHRNATIETNESIITIDEEYSE